LQLRGNGTLTPRSFDDDPAMVASSSAKWRIGAGKSRSRKPPPKKQILEDAEQLVTAWNERQAKRMPMLFSPTIGAAITAGYWFLRARCPVCRTAG
jgi:hypothetical protein